MAMQIAQSKTDGAALIEVQGEVDLYTSPDLRKAIMKAIKQFKEVRVDLSKVSYMDSSGVATLVEGLKSARNRSFVLVSPSTSVTKVLQLSRLDAVFQIDGGS